jgi:hypothetical protein
MLTNNLLLLGSVVFIFGAVLVATRAFGKAGLYCFSAVAMVVANIEVMLLIDAFGMEQTLGNVLFASTFLVTDILSECAGKKAAGKAVGVGLFTCAFFLLLSQSWLLYVPSVNDTVAPAFATVFGNTPRMMLASFGVYAVSQIFDVWLYHRWWDLTARLTGSRERFLWLRNTGSTLVSQLINTVLFTALAFWGTYDLATLASIALSSYVIYIATSLLDTPAVYLARRIWRKREAAV